MLVNGTSGYATASITFISYWTLLIAHWNPLKDSREVTCLLMNANMKTPKTDKLPGVNISLLAKQMCIINKLRRKRLRFQTTNVRPDQLLNYLVGKWLVEHEINAWKYAFWIANRKQRDPKTSILLSTSILTWVLNKVPRQASHNFKAALIASETIQRSRLIHRRVLRWMSWIAFTSHR